MSSYQPRDKLETIWLVMFCNLEVLEPIFSLARLSYLGLLKLNIKARQDIPEFSTANI